MHTQTPLLTAPPSLGRRLARVLRPGSIEPRVQAAATLPLWVAWLMVVLSVYLLAEGVANSLNAIESVDSPFGMSRSPRLWVLEWLLSSGSNFLGLFVLGLLLLTLEGVNFLILAPFGVPMGKKLRESLGNCRKVLYSLGGLWLVQATALWTLACFYAAPWLYWSVPRPPDANYFFIGEILITFLFGAALPLAMLLGLVMRLMGACSCLASGAGEPPVPICGGCGYLLEGLAAGAGCPECGLADPAEPDRARVATPWAAAQGIGRVGGLLRTAFAVGLQPGRLFRRMQVWGQAREGRRFACWTIWLSMPLAILSLPGVMAAWGHGPMNLEDWYMVPAVMAVIALLAALVIVLVHGLLIALIGWGISRARQEPAWPIAAAAGPYLAGLVPWIVAAQALWLWPFFVVNGDIDDQGNTIWHLCEAAERAAGIDSELLFVALLLLPAVLGFLLAVRTAVVCYRGVRFACR